MKDLLSLILKNIVTNPEAIEINVTQEEDREVYTIKVDPEDMGRVIGKSGKVIKAIRSLAHVMAIRQNKRFRINLADEVGAPVETVAETPDKTEEVSDIIDLSPEKEPEAEVKAEAETETEVEE